MGAPLELCQCRIYLPGQRLRRPYRLFQSQESAPEFDILPHLRA